MSKSYTETHCAQGHEWTSETKKFNNKGWVYCSICRKASDKKTRERPAVRDKKIATSREWRKNNPDRSRTLAKRNYNKIRKLIETTKEVPCFDCGKRFPHYVMDFHHLDPKSKNHNVGTSRSLKKTTEEMKKCIVICANCHRIRTWKEVTRWVEETE